MKYTEACKALTKWEHSENYSGEDYTAYFTGPTRNRDSQSIEESNFEAALKRLGGESETVVVAHFGHWACGWVEQILVHESNKTAVKALLPLFKKLKG